MYKAKLQEECQRQKWELPKYSCIKDGPANYPQFRASVSVNGVSFDSPTASKSSKDALNEAAKLAFLHFASDANPIAAEGPEIEQTNASDVKVDVKPIAAEETLTSPEIHSNASDIKLGVQHQQYKLQLQSFAQRKNLDPPLYSSKREGPPHALQFQATVTVDGHSFESPGYFRSLKEAEHAAAKVALMSLAVDSFQEIDARSYKNLLQELSQNEGFTKPVYKTVKCGPPHQLTFCSTVEVEGEIFQGKEGKSNKLAEQNAAKVAYTAFMERKSTRCGDLTSSGSSAKEMLKCSPTSALLPNVDPQQSLNPACPLSSSAAKVTEDQAKENEDEEVEGQSSSAVLTSPDLSTLSLSASNKEKRAEMKSYLLCNKVRVYTCIPSNDFPKGTVLLPIDDKKWVAVSLELPTESSPSLPEEGQSSSAVLTPPDLSTQSLSASNKEKRAEMKSYLLGNKVRVYTCIPSVDFPKGTVLFPIDDKKWVAINLGFPTEKV